ncbi:MAG: universal stress protein UspA [Frankiales bacterium]|nr:universal stress protein UspA [Frankiales bacterium]
MTDDLLSPAPRPHARPDRRSGVLLVGVDGQDGGDRALEVATGLAQRWGMRLVVGHVHPLSGALVPGECVQGLREDAELDLLLRASAVLDASDVPWELAVTTGDPALGLQELAERVDADLVVIGTHGCGWTSALRRAVHGSVSSRLVHGEHRPVLVVPPRS